MTETDPPKMILLTLVETLDNYWYCLHNPVRSASTDMSVKLVNKYGLMEYDEKSNFFLNKNGCLAKSTS